MNNFKKCFALLMVISLLCLNMTISVASNVSDSISSDTGGRASPVFNSKTISLSSAMRATMIASTSIICAKIYVQSVTLQKLASGTWVFVKSLPCPAAVYNTNVFGAGMDYSSHCTKGITYRIVVVFNGDGVTASATSGGVTYK